MNDCLLVKWIWKLFQEPDELWFKLVKAKYMPEGSVFYSNIKGSSQFWQDLHEVKHLFKWGAIFRIGDECHCKFWLDGWLHEVPLCISYDDLFKMVREPNSFVADCLDEGQWVIEFRRTLSVSEYNRWLDLMGELQAVNLNSNLDSVIWALESNKKFSTKSLYQFLIDCGVASKMAGYIWKAKLPLKIKVFLWQIFNNKLLVAQSLIKRGWKGSRGCCVCVWEI